MAWLSGTKDLLFACLSLLALNLYLGRQPGGRGRYLVATLVFAAALLSKPTAVVVPVMAVLLDVFVNGTPWKRSLLWLAPWFVMSIVIAVVAKLVQPAPLTDLPIHLRQLIAADAIAFYIYKLLLPLKLCIDYGRNPQAVTGSGAIAFTWIVPAGLAFGLWCMRGVAPAVRLSRRTGARYPSCPCSG